MIRPMIRLAPAVALLILALSCDRSPRVEPVGVKQGFRAVQHVVIIGVDGMSPEGIRRAKTPVMNQLIVEGAYTLHARAVFPTTSSANWASILTGMTPEQTGVTSNAWTIDKREIEPTAKGPGGMYPTIFCLVRQQRPQARIGVFHEWKDFGRLVEHDMVSVIRNPSGPQATVDEAAAYIRDQKPTLTFIHLDLVDNAGHADGWLSKPYEDAIEEADRLIGVTIESLKSAGIYDQTILLVTADHGGVGKNHGGVTLAELEIPWIIRGPGVSPKMLITIPVNTYDTAATVVYVLGLTPPKVWMARPVMAAFSSSEPQLARR